MKLHILFGFIVLSQPVLEKAFSELRQKTNSLSISVRISLGDWFFEKNMAFSFKNDWASSSTSSSAEWDNDESDEDSLVLFDVDLRDDHEDVEVVAWRSSAQLALGRPPEARPNKGPCQ